MKTIKIECKEDDIFIQQLEDGTMRLSQDNNDEDRVDSLICTVPEALSLATAIIEHCAEWVSVDERLPDEGSSVMLWREKEQGGYAEFVPSLSKEERRFLDWNGYTHWKYYTVTPPQPKP